MTIQFFFFKYVIKKNIYLLSEKIFIYLKKKWNPAASFQVFFLVVDNRQQMMAIICWTSHKELDGALTAVTRLGFLCLSSLNIILIH